jgi:hypothetical protein
MVGMTSEDRKRIVASINIANAECEDAVDLAMIHGNIVANHGSLENFNVSLKLMLLLDPLSYKEDLQQLARRSEGTRWDFRCVFDWLADGERRQKEARLLCVSAGAGTGKSTVSAAIVREVLGAGGTVVSSAHHFVKFSDARRLDPVRIVKSIVFQLAQRCDALQQELFALDAAVVDQLKSLEEACELLLPCVAATMATEPAVILIDALDEGDPPEQQRADFDSRTAGIAPAGNLALRLLVGFLVKQLPLNFRFVVTTRPDAVLGKVGEALELAFGEGGVVTVSPGELKVGGGGLSGFGASGGPAVGNLVYHAVV